MSIVSHAFGRVKLTEADARKFKNQVTYGKPKAAASKAVSDGIKLSQSLSKDGVVRLKLKKK